MHTTHFTWESEPAQVPGHEVELGTGKKNLLNNFCIYASGNEEKCMTCHAGYGWSDETFDFTNPLNVDCLACHADTAAYAKGELLATRADDKINLVMLDVRSEADFNQFHIRGTRHLPQDQTEALIPELLLEPAGSTVYVLMSNDKTAATQAWKTMVAQSVPNVYILEGGINKWKETFNASDPQITPTPVAPGNDLLGYTFQAALGDRYSAADPNPHEWELEYTPKIQLQQKRGPNGGGCE